MLIEKLTSFLKETVLDVVRILASKDGLKDLYGISLYRNAIYQMIEAVVVLLTGLLFWAMAARFYPIEAVGLTSAAISAIGLLTLLSALGLDYGLIRFLPGAGTKAGDMINSCLTLGGLISIVLALTFIAGLSLWSPALIPLQQQPILFVSFVFFSFIATLHTFTHQMFIAKRRASFALLQSLVFGITRFILLLLLLVFQSPTFGIFISYGVAISISVAIAVLLFVSREEKDYRPFPVLRKEVITEMVRFSFANYIANIFWLAPQLVLPLIVVNMLDAGQNAYFYIAWSVASVLFMIPTATSFSLFAEGSHDVERLDHETRKSLKLLLVLVVPATIGLVLLSEKILLLFGRTYSENSTMLLQILTFSMLPLSLNYVYYAVKRVEMRMKSVIFLTIFIAISTLGMSYFLLPRMGILGTGIAWLLSQGAGAMIVMYNFGRKWTRIFASRPS